LFRHRSVVTELYAELDAAKAVDAVKRIG